MARSLGTATIAVLAALQSHVRYGLDITARTGLQPATVYTSLRRLEKRGFVRGRWEEAEIAEAERRPRRRYYELTVDGESALQKAATKLGDLALGVVNSSPGPGKSDT
jgi:PadR family transcriptional regulator PadR